MPAEIHITWDEAAIKRGLREPVVSAIGHGMSTLADQLVLGDETALPGLPGRPVGVRRRPVARPQSSGTLRSSIQKFRQGDGSWLVGPTDTTPSGELLGPMIESRHPAPLHRQPRPVAAAEPRHRARSSGRTSTTPAPPRSRSSRPAAESMAGVRIVIS